jgi:hypothetical protein
MQELSAGKWADGDFRRTRKGQALVAEIIAVHPTSNYYPYALILDAVQRFPNSPALSYLYMSAGMIEREEQTSAVDRGDHQDADRHAAAAVKHFAKVLETTAGPSTRAMAQLLSVGIKDKIGD